MTRENLTKTASWLYRNDYDNPIRQEIYLFLQSYGVHPRVIIKDKIPESILVKVKEYNAIKEAEIKKNNKKRRK